MKTAFTYALLALLAMVINILVQDLLVTAYGGRFSVAVSMLMGTAAGLIVKYVLDRRYIFAVGAHKKRQDTRTFVLYALTGLVTTAIFWGMEFGFLLFFESKIMQYAGGVFGLTIGYVSKYYLDRSYVFCSQPA